MIDLTKVDYKLTLLPPNGSKIDITSLVDSCSHDEMDGEMAAKITVRMKNVKRADGWIHQHVFLDKRLILEATDGNGWKEIFRGSVKRWKTIAHDHTVEFTAYDPSFNAMISKEHYFFPAGMSASGSIRQIAKEQGIPLGRIDGPNTPLARKMYNGYIGDTIGERLKEARQKGGGNFIPRSTQGKFEVVKEGTNKKIYELTDLTVDSSSDERSIENLVTKVKVYGNEPKPKPKKKKKLAKGEKREKTITKPVNNDKRPAISSTVTGNTNYGVIQDILYSSNFDSMSAAKKAAQLLLKEKGVPEINRPLTHPDIPWIRKGDLIKINSGTINGNCIVESVSRNTQSRMMTLKLRGG
ncbi:XkdQ/YqbQ family protein [Sporosarcina sp. ITBMC105]